MVDPAVAVEARRVQVTLGFPDIKSKAGHLILRVLDLLIYRVYD